MKLILMQQRNKKKELTDSRTIVTNASDYQITQMQERYLKKYKKGIFISSEVNFVMKQDIHRYFNK